jgi:hypothetical protein
MGWAAVRNGELLTLASGRFDALVTVDQNLSFQHNITALPLAIIVLRGKTNRLADTLPLVQQLLRAIDSAKARRVTIVGP